MPIIPPPASPSPEYLEGYKAAVTDMLRELDNQLGTARNRNEYQHGRVDTLHDLRSLLTRRKASL